MIEKSNYQNTNDAYKKMNSIYESISSGEISFEDAVAEFTEDLASKDSKGDKISLELTITPNLIVDLGYDDNNIHGTSNFAKIMFVYPPRDQTMSASTNLVGEKAFTKGDMSVELLSVVRRTNKQVKTSEIIKKHRKNK